MTKFTAWMNDWESLADPNPLSDPSLNQLNIYITTLESRLAKQVMTPNERIDLKDRVKHLTEMLQQNTQAYRIAYAKSKARAAQ